MISTPLAPAFPWYEAELAAVFNWDRVCRNWESDMVGLTSAAELGKVDMDAGYCAPAVLVLSVIFVVVEDSQYIGLDLSQTSRYVVWKRYEMTRRRMMVSARLILSRPKAKLCRKRDMSQASH